MIKSKLFRQLGVEFAFSVLSVFAVMGISSVSGYAATFHVTVGTSNDDMSLMGMAFYPNALTVHRNDVIVFTNYGMEPHTVTFGVSQPIDNPEEYFLPSDNVSNGTATYSGSEVLNSGFLIPVSPDLPNTPTFEVTIAAGPGSYGFLCALHPLMTGNITVVDDAVALPKTDAAYQKLATRQMRHDLVEARRIQRESARAAERASDIGGTGIEVAVGGGNGVATVMRFFPSDLKIHVGDTVTFVNRDPYTPHTVTFGNEPGGGEDIALLVPPNGRAFPFDQPTLYDGTFDLNSGFLFSFLPWTEKFSVTFTAAGTFHYICGLHDLMGMVGTVEVN